MSGVRPPPTVKLRAAGAIVLASAGPLLSLRLLRVTLLR
jgi:hypothetical protein